MKTIVLENVREDHMGLLRELVPRATIIIRPVSAAMGTCSISPQPN